MEPLLPLLDKIEAALTTATTCQGFAPILCVSFLLGRRLGGTESSWFETLGAVSATTAILTQTVLAIVVPVVLGGRASHPDGCTEGDMEYEVENRMMGMGITIAKYLILLMTYILGAGMHLAWMFTRLSSSCNADLPAMGSALLALVWWRIHIGIYLGNTIKEFTGFDWPIMTMTWKNIEGSVLLMYAPTIMILLLFIDPQIDGLLSFFVTYGLPVALVTQSFWGFVAPFLFGMPAECDDDNGLLKLEVQDKLLSQIVMVSNMATVGLVYGGLLTGCLSMFLS